MKCALYSFWAFLPSSLGLYSFLFPLPLSFSIGDRTVPAACLETKMGKHFWLAFVVFQIFIYFLVSEFNALSDSSFFLCVRFPEHGFILESNIMIICFVSEISGRSLPMHQPSVASYTYMRPVLTAESTCFPREFNIKC